VTERGQVGDGVLVWVLVLALYWPGLAPGWRMHGDAAELALVAAVDGTAHAPGYPLWTALGHAFASWVPMGSAPWRVALFTAVTMASAAAALRGVLQRVGTSRVLAGGLAVAFAALPGPLRNATMPEVYGLHLLFVGLAWWFALGKTTRTAALSGLVAGVACGHHPTAVFLLPALWLVLAGRRARFLAGLGLGGALSALGVARMASRAASAPVVTRELAAGDVLGTMVGAPFQAHFAATPLSDQLGLLLSQSGALASLLMVAGLGGAFALRRWGFAVYGVLSAAFVLLWGVSDVEPFALPLVWLGVVVVGAASTRLPPMGPRVRAAGLGLTLGLPLLLASRTLLLSQPGTAAWQDARVRTVVHAMPEGTVLISGDWAQRMALLGAVLVEGTPGVQIAGRDPGAEAADEVAGFLMGNQELEIIETRSTVPPGTSVRIADLRHIPWLRARGLHLAPAEGGTWAVSSPQSKGQGAGVP
jgi:hypothetical protein